MHNLVRLLVSFFFRMGGLGLLVLGVADSSFLFLPLGNDLLMIALTARHHERMAYYALMTSVGSLIGVAFTDWVSRKGGQKGIEKNGKRSRQVRYVEKKMQDHGGAALGAAALMPPPFPFTIFIVVAAALQYPRRRLLVIVGACRTLRFVIDGVLAIVFGRAIIRMAKSGGFETFMMVLVAISIAGSAWSIFSWIRKSRSARREPQAVS